MKWDVIFLLVVLGVWFALQALDLPRFGVST